MVKIIKIFSIFLLIFSSSLCCCLNGNSNNEDNSGISAFEGKEIADPIALEWNENATLFEIRGHHKNKGLSDYWFYGYIYPNISENDTGFSICVFNDNSFRSRDCEILIEKKPICNFSIDSTDAYDVAILNEKIKAYLAKYKGHINHFVLWNIDNIHWRIEWEIDATGNEDYKRAEIHIDANTGEVLYVEASD